MTLKSEDLEFIKYVSEHLESNSLEDCSEELEDTLQEAFDKLNEEDNEDQKDDEIVESNYFNNSMIDLASKDLASYSSNIKSSMLEILSTNKDYITLQEDLELIDEVLDEAKAIKGKSLAGKLVSTIGTKIKGSDKKFPEIKKMVSKIDTLDVQEDKNNNFYKYTGTTDDGLIVLGGYKKVGQIQLEYINFKK